MIALACGILLVGQFPSLPATWLLGSLIVFAMLVAGFAHYKYLPFLAETLWLILFLLLGVYWHTFQAQRLLELRLPHSLEGRNLQVSGVVRSMPTNSIALQRFEFTILNSHDGLEGRRVLLNYYGAQQIKPGEHWNFTVRLNRPHGMANYGRFDYEAWLLQRRISARGYVRDDSDNRIIGTSRLSLQRWRFDFRQQILSASSELVNQPVLVALALGDRSLLTDGQQNLFARTGTSHLMVVSGLHIGFIAGLCYWLVRRLWFLHQGLAIYLPAQKAAAAAATGSALVYSLLAGFTLPTQRALVMVAVYMIAKIYGRRLGPGMCLLSALCAVLLLDPLAGLSASFWLSFCAVLALLIVFAPRRQFSVANQFSSWRGWLIAQLVVCIGLTVPVGFWIGELPMLSPLANCLAIPLVSWLVLPLTLLGSALVIVIPGLAPLPFILADHILLALLWSLEILLRYSGELNSWQPAFGGKVGVTLAVAGCLTLLIPTMLRYYWLATMMLMPIALPRARVAEPGSLELHLLDVGQGLAAIIRTSDHVLVYDSGPRYRSGFDTGSSIVLPVLNHLGIRHIDRLVISHGDNDHAGGAAGLAQQISVTDVVSGEPDKVNLPQVNACNTELTWQWDDVQFRFLHPVAGRQLVGNDSSCVLRVAGAELSILLPGDIEAAVERNLSGTYGRELASDVLVAPHHGSNSSSTYTFLAAVDPGLALVGAGYRNQFGHPASQVVERYRSFEVPLLNTAEHGMISVYNSGANDQIDVETQRRNYRRYWH